MTYFITSTAKRSKKDSLKKFWAAYDAEIRYRDVRRPAPKPPRRPSLFSRFYAWSHTPLGDGILSALVYLSALVTTWILVWVLSWIF